MFGRMCIPPGYLLIITKGINSEILRSQPRFELTCFIYFYFFVSLSLQYVDGYVFMSVSPAVQGVAHVLDLSDEISILEKPEDSFPHFCAVNLKVVSVDKDTQQLILQQSRELCKNGTRELKKNVSKLLLLFNTVLNK